MALVAGYVDAYALLSYGAAVIAAAQLSNRTAYAAQSIATLALAMGLPWDTHLHRVGIEAGIWAGFLSGAIICGAASTLFGVWALTAPCFILLALALRRAE